jgi:hypothetical protein
MRHWIPLTRRQVTGSLTWALLSLAGWGLFIYWWGAVYDAGQPRPLFRLLGFLIALCLLILLSTFSWIWHNLRIARRGNRGMAARYRPPTYEHDALDRRVIIDDAQLVRSAPVITVTADATTKTFTPHTPTQT